MTGQELAAKLRDLGFAQIKSHMTALSDFEALEIQARLEAYGIVDESAAKVTTVDGLKIKRKRKAPAGETEPSADSVEAEAHPAAPEVASAPAPAAVQEPEIEPPVAPELEAPEPVLPRAA